MVSHRQLTDDVGLSPSAIGRLCDSGALVPVLPTVVRLATAPDIFLARAMAVQLWSDGEGFVSSWSAARVLGLPGMPHDPVHFTVPAGGRSRRAPDWIRLESSCRYDAVADRLTTPSGLVVATPTLMLAGLAHDLDDRRLARAADDARRLGLVDLSAMVDQLARRDLDVDLRPGPSGVARVEPWPAPVGPQALSEPGRRTPDPAGRRGRRRCGAGRRRR